MKLLFCIMALSVSTAFADTGLDQLKESFSLLMQTSVKEFDKARAMKEFLIGKGAALPSSDCEAIKGKIRSSSSLDPFELWLEDGIALTYFCGNMEEVKTYSQNISGVTNLGLKYSMVVQLERVDLRTRRTMTNYFLDSNYRIVEKQNLFYDRQNDKLMEHEQVALDPNGNIYISEVDTDYTYVDGTAADVSGTRYVEKYITTDGFIPYPVSRELIKNKVDPKKDYQVLNFYRADKKDWQGFQLLLTHVLSGGIYNYGGKLFGAVNRPNFKSALTVKYRGGQEYCAFGDVKANQSTTALPVDQTAYRQCFGY